MKKLLPILLLLLMVSNTSRSQVALLHDSLVRTELTGATLCYNNSSCMSGNSVSDRYLLYFNNDTIYLNVKQSNTWTRKIAHSGNNIKSATITFHKDTIWICWKESAFIKTSYSTNKGNTWSNVLNVSPAGNVSAPSIYASRNGKIHFVWYNESASDTTVLHNVYFKGTFLSSPNTLSTTGFKASWPSVTAIGDTVLCSWKETHGVSKVYFSRSFNGGQSWSPSSFTNGPTTAKDPNLSYAYDGNTSTHYVYLVYDGTNKIYIQRSTDFGTNWSSPVVISNTAKNSQFAKVECNNSGFVGVSWEHRSGVNLHDDTKKDVGFAYSTNWASGSFSTDSLAYIRNPLGSPLTSLNKIDENNFYLVWISNDTVLNHTFIYERRIQSGFSNKIIEVEKKSKILVYPNPAKNFIIFQNQNQGSKPFQIKIFDLLGREVTAKTFFRTINQLDISSLKNGIYFFQTENDETHKIIINHENQ